MNDAPQVVHFRLKNQKAVQSLKGDSSVNVTGSQAVKDSPEVRSCQRCRVKCSRVKKRNTQVSD